MPLLKPSPDDHVLRLLQAVADQLSAIGKALGEFHGELFRGRMSNVRRIFSFLKDASILLENNALNTRIVSAKNGRVESNLVEYVRHQLRPEKADNLLRDMISLLGLLGSSRFSTGEETLKAFVERDLQGVTEEDFRRETAYYLEMFRDTAAPLLEKLSSLVSSLQAMIKELQLLQQEKEKRAIIIIKEDAYLDCLKKSPYKDRNNLALVQAVENKIEFNLSNNTFLDRVAKPLPGHPIYGGMLHAYLPMPLGNHRIVYTWDKASRTIRYVAIGTHKELGLA